MTEKQSPNDFTGSRVYGKSKVAADWQVTWWHSEVRSHLAIARILQNVTAAYRILTPKCRAKQRSSSRVSELLECLARCTGQRIKDVGLTIIIDHIVKKGAKLRAAQFRAGVGNHLQQRVELQ